MFDIPFLFLIQENPKKATKAICVLRVLLYYLSRRRKRVTKTRSLITELKIKIKVTLVFNSAIDF